MYPTILWHSNSNVPFCYDIEWEIPSVKMHVHRVKAHTHIYESSYESNPTTFFFFCRCLLMKRKQKCQCECDHIYISLAILTINQQAHVPPLDKQMSLPQCYVCALFYTANFTRSGVGTDFFEASVAVCYNSNRAVVTEGDIRNC